MRTQKALALVLLVALAACQSGPPGGTAVNPSATSSTMATAGMGTIKGRVSIDETGAGSIAADSSGYRLFSTPATDGTITARGPLGTREGSIGSDGTFSVVVPGGGEYHLEASVPDGRGGVTKAVSPPISVPLAEDPPIVDAASLVTRRTGSIQGLIELKDAQAGDTPEGADVFLSGGTSSVGKAGETGRFALTNVAEGTWNVVVSKPGYKRQRVNGVAVRAGRPALLDTPIVLERDVAQPTGVRGAVQSSDGKAIVGATVSLYPKDREALVSEDTGLDNFTAVTDEQGRYEIVNLPPGEFSLQVYRAFYQVPPARSVTIAANTVQEVGITKLASNVAYFGKISGVVFDDAGQPLEGAVVQLDPPVTDSQFADATGRFTLDRILPGEYTVSIAAGGFRPSLLPVVVDNRPNTVVTLPSGIALEKGKLSDGGVICTCIWPSPPPVSPSPSPTPTPRPTPTPTPSPSPTPTPTPSPSATPTPTPTPSPSPTPTPTPALRTFSGHADRVWGVAFSPDGTRVVSGSDDTTLKLWDVATGEALRTFSGHTAWVYGVAFSPDGTRVVGASADNTLRLWDVATGEALRTFRGHADRVWGVAFSPDGTRLASASDDKTLKLWAVSTGEALRTFRGHTEFVFGVAFSPDGTRLASASGDRTLKLWDVSTGAALRTFSGHTSFVYGVAFSPDGTRLASASGDKTLRLWDVSTGAALRNFSGHDGRVWGVAFSPDGTRLASASGDTTLRLWDVATGEALRTFSGHTGWVYGVAFSPDGTRVVSASGDKTLKLWDADPKWDALAKELAP